MRRRLVFRMVASAIAVGAVLLSLSFAGWATCTTGWVEPDDDDPHEGYSWDDGEGGRHYDDDLRASTSLNGDEHEYDDYAFTYADIPATAVIVGFEVRIRGYGLDGPASVSVALSDDGGSTIYLQSGTMPWGISLPSGSSNEAWNSVSIENPPFIHTFTPAEVCGGNDKFTVWVKANTGSAGTIYVDSVQVRVTYYDEVGSVWPNNPMPSSSTNEINTWHNASTWPMVDENPVTINWTSPDDNPTCDSGIDGYRYVWDTNSSTSLGESGGYYADEDDAHTQDFFLGNNEYWFHIRSIDNAGYLALDTEHYGPFQYDDYWPTNPVVTSSKLTGWSNTATVPIAATGAGDANSGVDGFAIAWDHSGAWTSDEVKDREETWTGQTFTMTADGVWYFHLITVDNADNWAAAGTDIETLGWFGVDTHAPNDPTVSSPTHAEGTRSSNSNVQIAVSGASDTAYGEPGHEASSGVDGFSVVWDHNATGVPDTTKDQEQTWTGTTTTLADGTWYYHLRTVDNAGNWTSTEDYGPITIDTLDPTVTVDIVDDSLNDGDISSNVTFEFSEDVTGFAIDDVTPNNGAVASFVVTDASHYSVTFTAADGVDGTGSVSVGAGTYTDLAGNNGVAGSDTVAIDRLNPTITSIVRQNPATENTEITPITFRVTFSEGVTNVDTTDFSLSGSATGVLDSVATAGSDAVYDVDVSISTGCGELDLDIASDNDIEDLVGNDLGGTPSIGTEETYTVQAPDIEVTADSVQAVASGDGEISVQGTITLANGGSGSNLTTNVALQFTLYDDMGCGGDVVDQWSETLTGVNIPSGGGTQVFTMTSHGITTNLCEHSTGCEVSIHVEADFADAIRECDETNNTYCSDKAVSIPDIEVGADALTITASDDGQVSVAGTIMLTNDGCGSNLTTNVAVRFTLYDGTGCGGGVVDQWSETLTGVNIASGGGTQVFTITPHGITTNLCDHSTGCEVSIHVEADYENAIAECDGTDNARCASPVSVDIPDIEVSGDALTITATDDGQVSVSGTITLTNDGCGSNLTTNVAVRFTLYDGTGCDGGVVDQWSETLTGVNIASVGGIQVFTITPHGITTNLCDHSTGCEVSIHVEADYENAIAECDGTDNVNCSDKPVSIPDIEVGADVLTVTCTTAGVTVGGSVTLRNAGCTSTLTSDVPVRLTLYGASGCGSPLQLISQWTEMFTGVNIATGGTQAFDITQMPIACSLCGCQDVSIQIEVDYSNAIAECDGSNNARCTNKTVVDTENPEIHDLRLDQHVLVDDCCEATIAFDGYVVDNCCVDEDDITFTVSNPTGNATVTLNRADVVFTDTGKYRVDFAGEIHVRCLTSCPAYVVLEVNAIDACGNPAETVSSEPNRASVLPPYTGGDVYDETAPVPLDDPRQDVYEGNRTDLDVRLCEDGVFRLMVREDTPVYIHPLYNDNDNCSDCTCCGQLWLYEIVREPEYGAASVVTDVGNCNGGIVIRYAPQQAYIGDDWFTYRIVDACGNVSDEATIRVQMVRETQVEDVSVIACSGEATTFEVSASDLFINPDDPEEIPFTFSLVSGPSSGVLLGDFDAIFYTAASQAVGPTGELVPTLDFVEAASIELTYASADGYVGRDRITFTFADPFANAAEGIVDILVTQCANAGSEVLEYVQGRKLVLILPETFEEVVAKAWHTVTVFSMPQGVSYPDALSAAWSEVLARHVLMLDTKKMPVGAYRLMVPLGNGNTVTVSFEVGESE